MERMENESLIVDLVQWVADEPRPYSQVMNAWRSSCPRLTIWEDCVDARLVHVDERMVSVTQRGIALLQRHHDTYQSNSLKRTHE